MKKRILSLVVCTALLFTGIFAVNEAYEDTFSKAEGAAPVEITAQSAVLMEPHSGTVLFEKNSHERLKPASVTKIMTLLLIYEAISSGQIKWEDKVTVSEHAESMGGSQVYLEVNEVQDVATMTKCIAVASANDAAVAMAEFVGGSEEAFVVMMNERAKELGMVDTNFENASGLDSDNHYSSAYDIALMSRELTTKHPEIFDYSTIWMDTIVHNTARGSEEFGLTNTNKLIQWYDGATGLKTGSTSLAKYCLSGTATRNGLDLIAVVMAAPDYKVRFQEVMKMLDYGFAVCRKYEDPVAGQDMGVLKVKKGMLEEVPVIAKDNFYYIVMDNKYDVNKIQKTVQIPEIIDAPVVKDQKVGDIVYTYDGKEVGKVDLIACEDVQSATLGYYIKLVFSRFFK